MTERLSMQACTYLNDHFQLLWFSVLSIFNTACKEKEKRRSIRQMCNNIFIAISISSNAIALGQYIFLWGFVSVYLLFWRLFQGVYYLITFNFLWAPLLGGVREARIVEWVAIPFSKRTSWPRVWTWVSRIVGRRFTIWATREISICLQYLQCGGPGFDPWVRKIPWRRKWQPTPVFLPGESHEWRSLVGYSPWGCKESDTTEWTT